MELKKRHIFLTWQEALFFVIYFVAFPLITGLQYRGSYSNEDFFVTFSYHTIAGLLDIIPFLFYYKVIVPRYLFTRRYVLFVCVLLLFIVAFDLYLRYIIDLGIWKMSFLPDEVQQLGKASFKRTRWIRQGITITFMNVLSVTALAFFVQVLRKERQVQQLQQQQLRMELHVLKAQLHPHFFFNTLNNIYSLALQQSSSTAPVVNKLATMMRYMLYQSDAPTVSLQQEIDFISNYISLEQLRHDANVQISFDFQGKANGMHLPPFLLLPFIENAFKHGTDNETGTGSIEIVIVAEPHELTMTVKNSKPKIAGNDMTEDKGVGLVNVQKRLALLYPDKYKLLATETERQYSVYLNLSLS
ncbi:MAG: histidine kinase [Chitinophagaceae bacterium]